MQNNGVPKLIDVICEAFMNALEGKPWHPIILQGHPPQTYCNRAVNWMLKKYGFTEFDRASTGIPDDAIWANAMGLHMRAHAEEWLAVQGDVAQARANEGSVVIASWINPAGDHGHVCVVRPGRMVMSGKWRKTVPKVMNIGLDVFIDKGANWAFSTEPEYHVLISTIPEPPGPALV